MTKKKFIFFTVFTTVFSITYAQSEQWKAYMDILKQNHQEKSPCEMVDLYSRIDSLFGGYIPVRRVEMNYMEAALRCGDTATFRKMAFRVVRWKGWNPLVFQYREQYQFLKDCDYWPELDSIQRIYGGKKDYSYAETLRYMEQTDQEARSAFHNRSLTPSEDDSLNRKMHEVDSVNLTMLQWLIDSLGFPTWERVCSFGSSAAWLIAQHSRPWYQYGYIKQLRQAVADTNADPTHLAYLEDRLRTGRGLPQLYGTQFMSDATNNKSVWSCPVADIKNVNFRREKMLMPPLEYYIDGYVKTAKELGMLDSDTPLIDIDEDYVSQYYLGNIFSIEPIEIQKGVTDAVSYSAAGEYCDAIPLFCQLLSNHYPFVRDLKRYLECLLRSDCVGNEYCYISHYEVLERMVLCGYQADAWVDSLPDSLSTLLRANYQTLREEYLRYLNHEDDAELRTALGSREAFEQLLRGGKNYHRYEVDTWNHAYPSLQKITDGLAENDYEDFFALLWREVERGNLHAEDFASLYDRTRYRLYGKDWYGTIAQFHNNIGTANPEGLNARRRAACLPQIKKSE